jgi:hypothetical protein
MVDRRRVAAQEQVAVDAVLLIDGSLPPGAPGSLTSRPARYVDTAGQPHQVDVAVVGRPPAGAAMRANWPRSSASSAFLIDNPPAYPVSAPFVAMMR